MHTSFALAPWLGALSLTVGAAQAGTWLPLHVLQRPFGVSSPPMEPQMAVQPNGHAVVMWNGVGQLRHAQRLPDGRWGASAGVPGAGAVAGPFAVALNRADLMAVAWTTVATRYEPSHLQVALRGADGAFLPAVTVTSGPGIWDLKLAVACDGALTLVWSDGQAIRLAERGGAPSAAGCTAAPPLASWSGVQTASALGVGARLPDLAANEAGAAVLAWQEGAPDAVRAVYRVAGGGWTPAATLSAPGAASWNPKPAIDAQGRAAVGFLWGNAMQVAQRGLDGQWTAAQTVSGSQTVYYPALGMDGGGQIVAAWQALDAGQTGSVWQRSGTAGGADWGAPQRLSARSESAQWPSVALATDGGLAVVGWIDNQSNTARAALRRSGDAAFSRRSLGAGWWGGVVAVGAGQGGATVAWGQPMAGNPNAARYVGRSAP